MLKVGDKAPDFTLISDEGREINLSDMKGKKVVLYFYPKDNTGGCTKEACSLRDRKEALSSLNAEIIGVSKDSTKSHQNFKLKQNLNFTLLSDSDTSVMKDYGAWGEKKLYGKVSEGTLRKTFIIDEEGTIIKIFDKVSVGTHGDDVKAYLETL